MSRPRRGAAVPRGRTGRRAAVRLLSCLLLVPLVAGAAGCSAASRQKVLEALFDDPPSKRRAREEERARANPAPPQTSRKARRVPRPVWRGSQHGPVAARLCQACHVAATGANPAQGAEAARLRRPVEKLCVSCHERRTLRAGLTWGDDVRWHGPVAAGLCTACHLPHRSREVKLLRAAPETICLGCHGESHLTGPPVPEGAGCLDCHDPHAPLMGGRGP